MQVKVKKLDEKAVVPRYAKAGDAGMDLTAISEDIKITKSGMIVEYGTGLSMEIPLGHVGLIFPRSSITSKTCLSLGNCVGVIDSGYRGEIKFQFRKFGQGQTKYSVGDRVGQMIIMPYPVVEFTEVEDLEESERGEEGFGSSGA